MATTPVQLPPKIDLVIIGAGPHALTFVTHLLQKRPKMQGRFLVFDPSGRWLNRWQQQFAALEIPHLRSPAVHHPDPNPFALRKFAESRPQELFPPYDLPGTQLFADLCHDVIQRWDVEDVVVPAKVTRLEPLPLHQRLRLWLQDGTSIIARRVVLATNNSQIQIPDWVNQIASEYPQDKLCHSQHIDLRQLHLTGERVLIVGAGHAIIDEDCQIVAAQWLGNHWQVKCNDGSEYECDRIWLSTGSKFDVIAEPLLAEISHAYPIPVVNGLPVLDSCLRWPSCELYLMGGLAALQVGPTARNLSGARMASEKIVPAIIKPRVSLAHPQIA